MTMKEVERVDGFFLLDLKKSIYLLLYIVYNIIMYTCIYYVNLNGAGQ